MTAAADDPPEPGQRASLAEFWSLPEEEVLALMHSTRTGLSSADATRARAGEGPSAVSQHGEQSPWRQLARQFVTPIELILIAATVLSGALGDWTDALIILVILLLSGMLGFVQERNAGKVMTALLTSVAIHARVRRDGAVTDVVLDAVVPGDVAEVRAGDVIPGDCLVLSSTGLTVDESALTGETFPVEKHEGTVTAGASIDERSNACFLGTHVVSGSGTLLVVLTGRETQLAGITRQLAARPP